MSKHSNPSRILAIDPGTGEVGFALFTVTGNRTTLVCYGVRNLRKEKIPEKVVAKGKSMVLDLFQRFSPHVLIVGKAEHPERKKNPVLKKLITQIRLLARKKGITVYNYDPSFAREVVSKGKKATKRELALAISSIYPELSRHIPGERRILWTHKDHYWLNVFDACTLALAYMEKEKDKPL